MKTINFGHKLPNKNRKQRGFTLIEIAIVLVIIGLLLGGVLQGQQLIENSRVKSATNDFNGIAAAVFSYQDRYGRLPGDDPGAITARGSSWPRAAALASQGNGVVETPAAPFAPAVGGVSGSDETQLFFQDLRSAGFISGAPTATGVASLPQNPFGGLITIATSAVLADVALGNTLNGTKVCMGNVSGTSAIALDTQLDDGSSNTGRLRAFDDGGVPNTTPGATATAAYSEDLSFTICYRI